MNRMPIVLLLIALQWVMTAFSTRANIHGTNFLRAPYLQMATPHSICVVWRTGSAIEPVVRFGLSPDRLEQEVRGKSIAIATGNTNKNTKLAPSVRRLHSAPNNCWQYEATITGLDPDTLYYYGIFDSENRLTTVDESYHFHTHPVPGTDKAMRFWVVGDSGTGRDAQATNYAAMVDFVKQQNHPLDFYLHVGDMAYLRGRDAEFQTRFFEVYEPTLRNTVCWAALGNHEGTTSRGTNGVGPYFDAYVLPTKAEAGGLASGTEAFYSFEYGRVHFVCLDSHDLDRKPTGAMARWLRADLENVQSDWIVAYFHHPPYTKGTHDSDRERQLVEMRTHIMPILESGGVDLVLTGHSHIYERSMLIDGAYATPTVAENAVLDDRDGDPDGSGAYRKSAGIHPNEGDVQVVAGNGGTVVRRKGTMPVMRKVVVEHGSVIVDIKGDTLTSIMLNKYGEVRDRFSIVKSSTVNLARIATPWQAPAYKPPSGPGKDFPGEPPEDFYEAILRHSDWRYFTGGHPETNWNTLKYKDDDWKSGPAGFGYGYNNVRTILADMRNSYSVVYLRHEFEIEHADYIAELGLMISYDDGFIAYLNGKEVARANVEKGRGKEAKGIKAHNASGRYYYYVLKDFEKYLKDGKNVLAIEGHNVGLDSSDFILDPWLLMED